ncbi:MAG: hypothetical protein WC505_07645 [Patescibacteria group bacterium]
MAKKVILDPETGEDTTLRTLHLVCTKHKCLARDCPCPTLDRPGPGRHVWVLGTTQERRQFLETGVEVDHWRENLCRDFYFPAEQQQHQAKNLKPAKV